MFYIKLVESGFVTFTLCDMIFSPLCDFAKLFVIKFCNRSSTDSSSQYTQNPATTNTYILFLVSKKKRKNHYSVTIHYSYYMPYLDILSLLIMLFF